MPTQPGETAPSIAEFVETLLGGLEVPAQVILEPGRSLVGQAGVTLYRVGAVKRSGDVTWVAVDGGISDNPRPQLYGARVTPRSWPHASRMRRPLRTASRESTASPATY